MKTLSDEVRLLVWGNYVVPIKRIIQQADKLMFIISVYLGIFPLKLLNKGAPTPFPSKSIARLPGHLFQKLYCNFPPASKELPDQAHRMKMINVPMLR